MREHRIIKQDNKELLHYYGTSYQFIFSLSPLLSLSIFLSKGHPYTEIWEVTKYVIFVLRLQHESNQGDLLGLESMYMHL